MLLCSLVGLWVFVLSLGAFAQDVSLTHEGSPNWWGDVQRSIRSSEYEPRLFEGVLAAANRAQNFRITFPVEGVVVVPRTGNPPWRWEIGLADARPVVPHPNGNRVEYRRDDVTEWYVNSDEGLKHGFTIVRPVAPYVRNEELRVALRIGGTLQVRQQGGRVDFLTADGTLAVRYDHVVVTDASGRHLDARMEPRGDRLDLVADLGGAAWPVVVDSLATSPNWTQESDQANAEFGISVASAGDVNGDGYADVIVGAHMYDNGQTNEGRAFVYYGSSSGLSTSPNWTAESDQVEARFGRFVASAGDVNGDGYADVIVSATAYDNDQPNEGRAFVYQGSSSGLSSTVNWTAESDKVDARFGGSVASAGDVNGDGYDDVIIGAVGYANDLREEGRAFVYYGSSSGLSNDANWTAESNQERAWFGLSVASAGDVNGDGYDDVIVGAPFYDNVQNDEGRGFVYHGSSSGLSNNANWTTEADQEGALFGFSVASAGDVNGDGYADVIAGAMLYRNGQVFEGRAFVYHGSSSGLSTTANWTAETNQVGALFGVSVASAGDVNGDGYADVIVGAHRHLNDEGHEGRAFVYHGTAVGLSTTANWTAGSDQADAEFSASVAAAGDVNGDGYADVIAGAPFYDNIQNDEGRAFVYHGSASEGALADLVITKKAADSGPYFVTQQVTYDIAVTNTGPAVAASVIVTDVLPAGTTFVSVKPSQGTCSGTSTVTCSLGTLTRGRTATIALTVRLDTDGAITNTAIVTSVTADTAPANSSASATLTAVAASAIPTLSKWILILLAMVIGTNAVLRLRV